MIIKKFTFLFFLSTSLIAQQKFVIVASGYNNQEWVVKHLNSLVHQNYLNYRIMYTDDCSTDCSQEVIKKYLKTEKKQVPLSLTFNKSRKTAFYNYYMMIHQCEDDEIIVMVDGDDWLIDNNVLSYLAQCYQENNIWMTYGNYQCLSDQSRGHCSKYDIQTIKNNSFRSTVWKVGHVRTFYAGLFKKILLKDLLINGQFPDVAWDILCMFPLLEMAGEHHYFIRDCLYVYNDLNPISDCKLQAKKQIMIDLYLRNQRSYKPERTYKKEQSNTTVHFVVFDQKNNLEKNASYSGIVSLPFDHYYKNFLQRHTQEFNTLILPKLLTDYKADYYCFCDGVVQYQKMQEHFKRFVTILQNSGSSYLLAAFEPLSCADSYKILDLEDNYTLLMLTNNDLIALLNSEKISYFFCSYNYLQNFFFQGKNLYKSFLSFLISCISGSCDLEHFFVFKK